MTLYVLTFKQNPYFHCYGIHVGQIRAPIQAEESLSCL